MILEMIYNVSDFIEIFMLILGTIYIFYFPISKDKLSSLVNVICTGSITIIRLVKVPMEFFLEKNYKVSLMIAILFAFSTFVNYKRYKNNF